MAFRFVLPLPSFLLHPVTSVVVCVVHIYLAFGHLSQLAAGDVQWTHIWKGFGALAGAYILQRWRPAVLSNTRIIAVLPAFCGHAG
jgi:hypothetical protein